MIQLVAIGYLLTIFWAKIVYSCGVGWMVCTIASVTVAVTISHLITSVIAILLLLPSAIMVLVENWFGTSTFPTQS